MLNKYSLFYYFRAFFAPRSEDSSSSIPSTTTPLSPTNYQQPPTPDHPPPDPATAEKLILDRIRPLSQVCESEEIELEVKNVNVEYML